MKTILISAYSCNPSKGSEPGNGWQWALGVAKLGYNVHVLTLSEGRFEILKELALVPNLKIHFHYVDHSKFWSKAYYWNFILMYIAYWLWQRKIYSYTSKNFKKNEIHFIHHVTWGSLKIGSKLVKLNIPMLFGPVGGGQQTPLKYKKYLGSDYIKEKWRNLLGIFILNNNPYSKEVLRKCQMLVTNHDTLELVRLFCNAKLPPKLIFDAAIKSPKVNLNLINNRDQTKLNLIWVGRIHGFKGLSLIITALTLIEKKHLSHIHLEIVGDGPDREKMVKLIKEYKLESYITTVGMVPYHCVEEYYAKNNAFIYTSLRDSFPSQILEAQLWSLPVITLNLHGQALMVDDSIGFKCEVFEPDKTVKQIADSILYLLNNPHERIIMGKKAREHAVLQTWDKKIENIVKEFYPKNL